MTNDAGTNASARPVEAKLTAVFQCWTLTRGALRVRDFAFLLLSSKLFALEPGADGLDEFCLAFQRQPMCGGHTRHGKVWAGRAHRIA